ncbi:nucleoside monophosphate kinase [Patescibacteria group bacterium]|nr:nucleoside monophosphate kinase [Patescibacteria group bacterium]
MDIILFGMQGSGKGTQGRYLAEKNGLTIFEMGGQLRQIIESDSPLGEKIKGIVQAGNLVDDDTIMEVVKNFLSFLSGEKAVLFDGIPRTVAQSEKLLDLLAKYQRDAFAVLIKISEDEAIKRLTQRRVCEGCKGVYPPSYKADTCEHCGGQLVVRHDDNLESIQRRLENYKNETLPVINSFYERDRLIEVDGEQSIEKVTKEMFEKVDYLFT